MSHDLNKCSLKDEKAYHMNISIQISKDKDGLKLIHHLDIQINYFREEFKF